MGLIVLEMESVLLNKPKLKKRNKDAEIELKKTKSKPAIEKKQKKSCRISTSANFSIL